MNKYLDEGYSFERTYSFKEAAEFLKLSFGRNTLFQILREKGILSDTNIPHQQFFDLGYFKLRSKQRQYQTGKYDDVPIFTGLGLEFIRKVLSENPTPITFKPRHPHDSSFNL